MQNKIRIKNYVKNTILSKKQVQKEGQRMVGNCTVKNCPTSPAKESEGFKKDQSRKPDQSNLSAQLDIRQKHKVQSVHEAEPVEDQRRCKSLTDPKSPTDRTRSVQEKSNAAFEDFLAGCVHIFHPL